MKAMRVFQVLCGVPVLIGARVSCSREYVGAVLILLTIVAIAQAKYSGGTGDPNDPYQIATAGDLIALGDDPNDYDKHFILTADIDLDPNLPGRKVFDKAVIAPDTNEATSWFDGTRFTGAFNGDDHKISHLTIKGQDYLGLFGELGAWGSKAMIKDLIVVDANVTGSGGHVGAMLGQNEGDVIHCSSTGAVSGNHSVGGLVGFNLGTLTSCYSMGSVYGIGQGSWSIGGLVGDSYGSVVLCCSTSSVRGTSYVGGLIGWNRDRILDSCVTGSVDGRSCIGGLVGKNGIDECTGGRSPCSPGIISSCYSASLVTGIDNTGGLIGYNEYGQVYNSLWDIETSGRQNSDGGTGKTAAEMQRIQTYQDIGWDFLGKVQDGIHEIWQMQQGGGYPLLAVFNGYVPPQLRGRGTEDNPYLISDAIELVLL
jgi:hypothetical protein